MKVFLNPYEVAFEYREKFWKGVITLPLRRKAPPPTGFIGYKAEYPTVKQIQTWIDEGNHNIGLRLAGVDADYEIMALDVDHYIKDGKPKVGGDQLAVLEAELGPLPETWICSNRVDGISGIRFFKVPRGYVFPGKPDKNSKDIDVICKHERFAAVWPSMHPDGRQYTWFGKGVPLTEEGAAQWDGVLPDARWLPLLPEAWLNYLTQGKTVTGDEGLKDNESTLAEIEKWAEDTFHGFDKEPCFRMREKLDEHKKLIKEEASSFPFLRDGVMNLVHLAREGHVGLDKAIAEISERYEEVCAERVKRDPDIVAGEIFRSVTGALRKTKALIEKGTKPLLTQCDQPGGLCDTSNVTVPVGTMNERLNGQLRMAYRFADEFDGKLLYVHGVGWHYWDDTRWAYDDIGKTHRYAMATLKNSWMAARKLQPKSERTRLITAISKCDSNSGLNGMISLASKLKQFAVTVRDIDRNPYLLNVQNGTLNLQNMELQSHNPEDRITKICGAGYQPEVRSQVWESFLERVLPDVEVREYLQRLAGVSLLGKVQEHILAILTGSGRNGKSTFYEALLHAMADYANMAEPDLFMHRENAHPTGEMDLRGRRLVVVSESDKNRKLAEATMRRLTGGDPIKARHMRQDFVEFTPSHTAMLITNHLPRVSGDDPATWARMRVTPFSVVIPKAERDTHLGDRLRGEVDAVLTWAIEGWQQYCAVGMAEPQAVLAATDKYQRDSDDLAAFLSECCTVGEGAKNREAQTRELHARWKRWQEENSCPAMGEREFGRALDAKGHTVMSSVDGKKRVRMGLGFKIVRVPDQGFAQQT